MFSVSDIQPSIKAVNQNVRLCVRSCGGADRAAHTAPRCGIVVLEPLWIKWRRAALPLKYQDRCRKMRLRHFTDLFIAVLLGFLEIGAIIPVKPALLRQKTLGNRSYQFIQRFLNSAGFKKHLYYFDRLLRVLLAQSVTFSK